MPEPFLYAGRRCWVFHTESSREVYDRTQCDDSIKDGDILFVTTEKVVGILAGAWPIAVTEKHGEFHRLAPGVEWHYVGVGIGSQPGQYVDIVKVAREIARNNEWPIAIE